MLEILAIVFLAKRIGEIVERKGYAKGKYMLMGVGMWLGAELIGAIIGAIFVAVIGGGECLIYIIALAMAATGGYFAMRIAEGLPRNPDSIA